MKRIIAALAVALITLIAFAPAASAKPSGDNLAPTIVVDNGDGTFTASTAALPKGECVPAPHATTGDCSLNVRSQTSLALFGVPFGGGPVTFTPNNCPCTAQFVVHAGQAKPYSAVSDPFAPLAP